MAVEQRNKHCACHAMSNKSGMITITGLDRSIYRLQSSSFFCYSLKFSFGDLILELVTVQTCGFLCKIFPLLGAAHPPYVLYSSVALCSHCLKSFVYIFCNLDNLKNMLWCKLLSLCCSRENDVVAEDFCKHSCLTVCIFSQDRNAAECVLVSISFK